MPRTYPIRHLTFAVAKYAPVGVVIAAWSKKLSRMYLWDTETDEFTAGQFVKSSARVLDISPDGKYVAYRSGSKELGTKLVGVSRPPFFSALAFFPAESYSSPRAAFDEPNVLFVETPMGYRNARGWEERVEPGCPFEIRHQFPREKVVYEPHVYAGDRLIRSRAQDLMDCRGEAGLCEVIRSFPREEFEEVVPPDWAKMWG